MLANGQRYYLLTYKTRVKHKLHSFLDGTGTDMSKHIFWVQPFDGAYILVTFAGTVWNIQSLRDAIIKSVENDITFVLTEIANDKIEGFLPRDAWVAIRDSRSITTKFMTLTRKAKLRRVIKEKDERKQEEQNNA